MKHSAWFMLLALLVFILQTMHDTEGQLCCRFKRFRRSGRSFKIVSNPQIMIHIQSLNFMQSLMKYIPREFGNIAFSERTKSLREEVPPLLSCKMAIVFAVSSR